MSHSMPFTPISKTRGRAACDWLNTKSGARIQAVKIIIRNRIF
jgi:hypothetical protein